MIPETIQLNFTIFQSLPATPYFKMIDIWLFFSMNLMVVSIQRKKEVTELWQVVCLIFHTYLEYVVQTVEKSEKRYVPTLPFPEKIFLFSLSNLKTAASVMSSVRPILVSPHTLIRGTVSADVYRRPSIKTVYEPMPDDRPRCSLRVNSSWFFLSAFCFPIHPQGTGCSFFQATG